MHFNKSPNLFTFVLCYEKLPFIWQNVFEGIGIDLDMKWSLELFSHPDQTSYKFFSDCQFIKAELFEPVVHVLDFTTK